MSVCVLKICLFRWKNHKNFKSFYKKFRSPTTRIFVFLEECAFVGWANVAIGWADGCNGANANIGGNKYYILPKLYRLYYIHIYNRVEQFRFR